jgi:hypothetical protein
VAVFVDDKDKEVGRKGLGHGVPASRDGSPGALVMKLADVVMKLEDVAMKLADVYRSIEMERLSMEKEMMRVENLGEINDDDNWPMVSTSLTANNPHVLVFLCVGCLLKFDFSLVCWRRDLIC